MLQNKDKTAVQKGAAITKCEIIITATLKHKFDAQKMGEKTSN